MGRDAKESLCSASSIELDHGFEVRYSSEMMDRCCKVQCKLFIQSWTSETFEG